MTSEQLLADIIKTFDYQRGCYTSPTIDKVARWTEAYAKLTSAKATPEPVAEDTTHERGWNIDRMTEEGDVIVVSHPAIGLARVTSQSRSLLEGVLFSLCDDILLDRTSLKTLLPLRKDRKGSPA